MTSSSTGATSTSDLGFIHRYIPPTVEGIPTLLLLHGTGGDENDLLDLGRLLAPGAGLLSPRGKVLEHGMPRFFRRLAEGIFDLDDLRLRTHELADFVAQAASAYGFDPTRVVAVGFSNGANIAASMLLLRPGSLAGGALLHAMVPLEPESPPNLHGKYVFIGAGQRDPLISPQETERLASMLRGYGATVEESWQPGGHSLNRAEVVAARDWLQSQQW